MIGLMATMLVQPPMVRAPTMAAVAPPHGLISTTHQRTRFGEFSSGLRPTSTAVRVAEQSSSLVGDDTPTAIKAKLYHALKGINRGIFGVPSAKKSEIEALVKQLESQNPTPDPFLNLDKMGGCWKLVYSTITILGSKRTKLGLRDFVSLGDFLQKIDIVEGKAVNVIKFDVRGLNLFNGRLTIEAFFKKASESRVEISYENSTITPEQLMSVFRKNYDLLLRIFNPEGWLEITYPKSLISLSLCLGFEYLDADILCFPEFNCCRYVDDTLRIGRDDKGNIFILERTHDYSV